MSKINDVMPSEELAEVIANTQYDFFANVSSYWINSEKIDFEYTTRKRGGAIDRIGSEEQVLEVLRKLHSDAIVYLIEVNCDEESDGWVEKWEFVEGNLWKRTA